MRSVRCDRCGVKALIAASQCPKCGHLFEMRDGFGELLPLAFCASCDSYYPEHLGTCKWCGTKPDRPPIAPYVWRGAAVTAFVGLAFAAWIAHASVTKEPPDARARAAAMEPDAMSVPAESIASNPSNASHAVIPAGSVASAPTPAAPADSATTTTTSASAGSIAVDSTAPSSVPATGPNTPLDTTAAKPAPRMVVAAKPPEKPVAEKSATRSLSLPRTRAKWVSTVSRNWVVVRADANRGARIVASIGPNSRVQLGEARGSWRRIRTKGIAGWVEHRAFFSGARASKKLAVR